MSPAVPGDRIGDGDGVVAGQRATLLALINGAWTTQALAAAATLGIPARLVREPTTAAALAEATDSDPQALRRLLHGLAALGICVEGDDGRWALTPLGRRLDPDDPHTLEPWARLRVRRWAEWSDLAETVRTGISHRRRHGGRDDFSRLHDTPEAALFHRAMAAMTRRVAGGVAAVAGLAGTETVVDVGGGSGEAVAALLATRPGLSGIVLDQPHAAASAARHLAERGVADRCAFVAGSFFDPWPRGDVYLLKSVLHNWSDAEASRIVARAGEAMRGRAARLLIVERVAPARWRDSPDHRACAASDLNMMVCLGGRERTEADFAGLLATAGLALRSIVPVGSEFSVVEAGLAATAA